MNGKALSEMWINVEEEGTKAYREEEEKDMKKYLEDVEKYKKATSMMIN